MPIADPAQLLQRVPELEALADDPRIGRALASGDPFKVFRALMLARLLRRLPGHRALLKELTGERRLFAKPLKGTPALGSINSVGFGFVGNAEEDTDGSHIALHAIVVLFAIPIVPLGAYVVRSTGSRQWQIYARAPLGILGWLYTRGLAAALVVLVGVGAIHSIEATGHQDLVVLNGFEEPLIVAFGAQTQTVPAQGRIKVTLAAGALHGTATSAHAGVVDTINTPLASSARLSIWNIAGAAPLVRNTVIYSRTKASGPAPANLQVVYCGKQFVELDDVRFRFEEPPATMSMDKHTDSVSVQHVTVASEPKVAGATSCANYLLGRPASKDTAALLAALAQLKNWDEDMAGFAIFAARSVSTADAVGVARRAARAHPDNLRMARILQDVRIDAGELDAMLAEHAARAQAHPGSDREQYLYASLLQGQAGIDRLAQLNAQFPMQPAILRSLAWRRANHGDAQGALRDLARLHALAPADAALLMGVEARALVATQRGADAMRLLDAGARDPAGGARAEHAREFALIAQQFKRDGAATLAAVGAGDSPQSLDFQRVCVGLAPLDPASAGATQVRLALALRDAPEKALRIAATLERIELMGFPEDHRALLYGEAVRTGQARLARTMGATLGVGGAAEALLQRYVRGDAVALDGIDLELDVQAAAMLVRSRNAQLPAGERAALRSQAARTDLLRGAVSKALNQWQG